MNPYVPEELPPRSIRWEEHIPLIGKANAALARYDGILQSIVNPGVMLSPLTTQEAVLSSRIEGTRASLEEVLEFEADFKEKITPEKQADIREIVNYRRAMTVAVEEMNEKPLRINLVRDLHRILLQGARGANRAPGEFRRVQNYIGASGTSIEQASFVPPSPEKVLPAMSTWEKYLHAVEKDPLVQLAVAKAQFELIHPFLDGNGRIGRILIPIFLYHKEVLSSPVFYLSAYLERNRETYYERLKAISSEGDWNGWIRFFLSAVIEQAVRNSQKVRSILELYDRMKEAVPTVTRSQYAIRVIDSMFDQPVFNSADFIKLSGIPRGGSASRILNALRDKGILVALRAGRGSQSAVFYFPELLRIAEEI